jgi:hypothetical protein
LAGASLFMCQTISLFRQPREDFSRLLHFNR